MIVYQSKVLDFITNLFKIEKLNETGKVNYCFLIDALVSYFWDYCNDLSWMLMMLNYLFNVFLSFSDNTKIVAMNSFGKNIWWRFKIIDEKKMQPQESV